jgi:hypothetical protein
MTFGVLDELLNDGVASAALRAPTGRLARLALLQRPEVQWVRAALRTRELGCEATMAFVSSLVRSLHPGERLDGDAALAALAVALESSFSAFSDEYLRRLSSVHAAEAPMSPAVARECLRQRSRLGANLVRVNRHEHLPVPALATEVRPHRVPAVNQVLFVARQAA